MPRRRVTSSLFGPLVALILCFTPLTTIATRQTPEATPAPSTSQEPVIFFAADGMRPDLLEQYVADGALPTFADLIERGIHGDNGLLQAFPPNTGVGWATLATGTWPGEHGSTNNTFHRSGEADFAASTSFAAPGVLQADTLAQAAERAGKSVVAVEWPGARGLDPA
ncbi:MAG: alkaline phosphatase family protein, partial [Chloroflexota bacterium]|nr:alkaline phosphatase family protein [Chloroflexota bacterium]